MLFSIKIQHRSSGIKPWKWAIYGDGRLVTASHDFFGTQIEAHRLGRFALKQLQDDAAVPPQH
jgi:hypothetical protein